MEWIKIQRLSRAAAWQLALAIVLLSVVPPSYRPTFAPSYTLAHILEHLVAFFATGVAFGIGYSNRLAALTCALLAFTGAIELAQLWVPGRHARISDFLIDATALCAGIGLSQVLLGFSNARFPTPAAGGQPHGKDPAGPGAQTSQTGHGAGDDISPTRERSTPNKPS